MCYPVPTRSKNSPPPIQKMKILYKTFFLKEDSQRVKSSYTSISCTASSENRQKSIAWGLPMGLHELNPNATYGGVDAGTPLGH